MIDITTLTELVEPLSRIEVAASKVGYKPTKILWVILIITIAIIGIWAYIVHKEKQKMEID